MSKINKRLGIAEPTSQCLPSRVKELTLHVDNPSLEGLELVSLWPDLEAVKSNAFSSWWKASGGKLEPGCDFQNVQVPLNEGST